MIKKYTEYIFFITIFSLILLTTFRFYSNSFFKIKNKNNISKKELEKIIIHAKEKLGENPTDITALVELGIAHFYSGEEFYMDAINEFEKAREFGSLEPLIPYYLAIMYEKVGLNKYAEKEYAKFLRNFPDNIEVRVKLGNLYFVEDKFQEAIEQFEYAYSLKPHDTVILTNLLFAYKNVNAFEKSLEIFQKLTETTKAIPKKVYLAIAYIYFQTGNWNDAIKYLNLEEKNYPEIPDIYKLRAICWEKLKNKNNAIQDWERLLKIDSKNLTAKEHLKLLKK